MLAYIRSGTGCLAILFFLTLIFSFSATETFAQRSESIQPGVLRIKISEGMAKQLEKADFHTNSRKHVVTGHGALDKLTDQFHVKAMRRVFPYAGKYEAKHKK